MLRKSHLINIHSGVVEGGLLFLASHPFHLSGSEAISGSEDKRPNTVTKDLLLLPLRKCQGFGELGTVDKHQIYTRNIF